MLAYKCVTKSEKILPEVFIRYFLMLLTNMAAAAAAAQNQEPVNLRYDSIRSQLNRTRNALLPRIPRAVGQVII